MFSYSRFSAAYRAGISNSHPCLHENSVPEWVGTDSDPVWLRVRAEVAQFPPIKDVAAAAHECQVALARLSAHADAKGPIAEATSQALLSLVIDIHHECRRIRARQSDNNHAQTSPRTQQLGPMHLWQWLNDPVGSGEPVSYEHLDQLRRKHRLTAGFRLTFAFLTGLILAFGMPELALVSLLVPVAVSGFVRYQSNAEVAVTFRGRYLSCLMGHLGDAAVLLGAFAWSSHNSPLPLSFAPAMTLIVLLVGTTIRTGALQVGVYVPRRRVERVIRIAAFATGIALTSVGYTWGFVATLVIATAFVLIENQRILRGVWNAGGAEFAWTVRTDEGITSEMFAAPLPPRQNPTNNPSLVDVQ